MARGRSGWRRFSNGATISTRCIRASRRRDCATIVASVRRFGLKREDFLAIVDGMEMDVPQDIRAPDLATLDLYCDRVASAVGRLSVRVFGLAEDDGILLAHHLGRALQLTNILRDIDEDAGIGRLYLPREGLLHAGITSDRSAQGDRRSGAAESMRAAGRRGRGRISRRPTKSWRRNRRRVVRAPRIMSKYYRAILELLVAEASPPPRAPVRLNKAGPHRHPPSLRIHLMQNTVHIIGAGISGLSAAVRLANANFKVHVHEATQQAGGRCRSYFDAATNLTIDNGNHLLLSGNRHAVAYARSIGTEAGLVGPKRAQFPFVDLTTGQRWQLDLGDGRLPLWVFDEARRVPDTGLLDYLALMPLIWAAQGKLVGDAIPCEGTLYQRLVQPLLLAALNVDPPEGSAGLAGAMVRETLLAGGQACRPLIARDGLSAVLVEPAIKLLQDKGASIQFGHELREFAMSADRVGELKFGDDSVAVGPDDAVVMAVPPRPAAALLPGLKTPTKFRAIVNAHFRFDPPKDMPRDPRRRRRAGGVAVRVPAAAVDHHQQCRPAGGHAARGTRAGDLAGYLQGRRRRRANCRPGRSCASAAPHSRPRRNKTRCGRAPVTAYKNLFLAGDWTDTGLPATIEGSVRSGDRAADLVLAMRQA